MGLTMSEEEIARLYKEAANKSKQITILSQLNLVTRREIIRVLRSRGLETPPPRKRPRRIANEKKIRAMAKEGLTTRQIANALGMDYNCVYGWLKRRGLFRAEKEG